MIIDTLYAKDFMKLQEIDIAIKPGAMPILTGPNGHGKSAIFYAIALVLTGYKKGSTYRNYIRRGASKFTVRCTFRMTPSGDPFEATFVCSATKTIPMKKELTHRGYTYTGSDYDEYLKTFFDPDLLNALTFSFQNESDISRYKPWQLRDLLKTVFRTNFDTERSAVKDSTAAMHERVRDLQTQVDTMQSSINVLEDEVQVLDRPPSDQAIQEAITNVETLHTEYRDLQTHVTGLRELELSVDVAERDYASAADTYNRERTLQSTLKDTIQNEESSLETLREKLRKAVIAEQDVNTLERQLHDTQEDVSRNKVSIEDISTKLRIVDRGACPTCEREAPREWLNVREDLEAEQEQLRIAHVEAAKSIKALQRELHAAHAQQASRQQIEASIERTETALAKAQDQLQARTESQKLETYAHARDTAHEAYQKLQAEYHRQRETAQGTLQVLANLEERIRVAESVRDNLQQAAREYTLRKQMLEESTERKQRLQDKLDAAIADLTSTRSSLAPYDIASKIVDKHLPTYGILLAGTRVVHQMLNVIHPIFPSWELRLVPCRDGVAFEYRDADTDVEEWSPISLASGFEGALCSVAFKLTLTAFYNLPLLILDEVDAAANDENSYLVFDSIIQFVDAYDIHQTWLVSHRKHVIEQLVREYGGGIQHYEVEEGDIRLLWISDDV